MAERAEDWQCPNPICVNHSKMVFGSKASCPKCGTSREGATGMMGQQQQQTDEGRAGDWQCPNGSCINNQKMVFGKYQSCPKCGTARNAKQAGDWLCPNAQCVNHTNCVFASKPMCPKCGCPRPGTAPAMMMPQMQGQAANAGKGGMVQGRAGTLPQAVMMNQMAQHSAGVSGNPGDWKCPNASCQNNTRMVFAKNMSCPKCGMQKPTTPTAGRMGGNAGMGMGMIGGTNMNMQAMQAMQTLQALGMLPAGLMGAMGGNTMPGAMGGNMGAAMQTKGRGSMPGDWNCPNTDCQNHRNKVFAKHAQCPNCGSEKPARSRSPHRMGM